MAARDPGVRVETESDSAQRAYPDARDDPIPYPAQLAVAVRILSIVACGRLAERHCRKAGQPLPVEQLVRMLEAHDVLTDRAQASIRLAVTVGRLDAVTDREGRQCVQIPDRGEEVA